MDRPHRVTVGRRCRLVMGLTYDVLTGDYYDRLGYRTRRHHRELPYRYQHPLVLQGSLGTTWTPSRTRRGRVLLHAAAATRS